MKIYFMRNFNFISKNSTCETLHESPNFIILYVKLTGRWHEHDERCNRMAELLLTSGHTRESTRLSNEKKLAKC